MTSAAFEVNFDGLVGPTHNYAGLSAGNIASTANRASLSNPRKAALEGLEKMLAVMKLGLRQGVLPPQPRPSVAALRGLGYRGTDAEVLARAGKEAPGLLAACSSASAMWTANAATVAPSADTADGRVHFTPANLVSKFHRTLEPETTARVLRAVFADERRFAHHPPLAGGASLGDEGAANHTRLCRSYGGRGVHLFVYGRHAFGPKRPEPRRFPARQTFEASAAVARLHELDPAAVVFAQQNPRAIDAGVFHNDVASVGDRALYFLHEHAFASPGAVTRELRRRFEKVCGGELRVLQVSARQVGLRDAVRSYLFNSQLVEVAGGRTALIAPTECRETRSVRRYLDGLLERGKGPIDEVHYLDVRQSMRNGGGPACLRLRVALTAGELAAARGRVVLDHRLYDELRAWVEKHYRDRLGPRDLADPKLLEESRAALDELTRILGLPSIYDFQR